MLDSLRGSVLSKGDDFVVIECGGVGFRVRVPRGTAAIALPGKNAHLHCRLFLKDELFQLYGFASELERDTFVLFQNVSGLGPEKALSLLNAMTPAEIATAIEDETPKTFQTVRGIGTKLAQRIVLELKGRFAHFERAESPPASEAPRGRVRDLAGALVSLGYPRAGAERIADGIVRTAEPASSLEQLLKLALRRPGLDGNLELGR